MCSWSKVTNSFQLKTFDGEHKCSWTMSTKQVSSKWLVINLLPFLRCNAYPKGKDIINYIKETFSLVVSIVMTYKSWEKAKSLLKGSEKEQYRHVREYVGEILQSNLGFRCQISVGRIITEMLPSFNRLYMCFDACKKGFLTAYRLMIGLDGCFLKRCYGG